MTRALASLAVLFVAGCASEPEVPPPVEMRGVYLGPRFDGEAASVDHEAIGDRMPAMRMDVRVGDPSVLDGVAPGDTVVFRVDSVSLTTIWGGEPLPPGTTRDLYDPEADTSGAQLVAPE